MVKKSKLLIEPSISISRPLPSNFVEADLDLFEHDSSYRTNDVYLNSVTDVWISPDSAVYKNGLLIRDTLADSGQWFYYQTRSLAKYLLNFKRVSLEVSARYMLATDGWSVGHFHWLTETLPRLWAARDHLKDHVLLLPDAPYVRKTGMESLTLLGLTPAAIVFMEPENFLKVHDLNYVSRIAGPGRMHDRLMTEIGQALVGKKRPENLKIYFSRARAGFRKILNEDELIAMLKSHGFEIVYGESNTLAEQIELFSRCSTLIGLHGAGLANCLFMASGGKVVELLKREPNHGYWHLAESVGHKYFYYHGEPDSELSLIGRGCNLTIPVDDFEKNILSRFK